MSTNIGLLPQLSGGFVTATNSDWRYTIPFVQPAPNQAQPLDLTGIAFRAAVRSAADAVTIHLRLSTDDGTLVNGGPAGTLAFAVPAARMQRLPPGAYVVDVLAVADGQQINLFLGGPAALAHGAGVTP